MLRKLAIILAAALSVVAGGCGSTTLLRGGRSSTSGSSTSSQPASVAVIVRWSDALRRGDVRAAAGLFALPSVFQDGPGGVISIHTFRDALRANEDLSCGAQFLSSEQDGRYVNALFRLTGRSGPGGGNCGSGAGGTARTIFDIKGGRIVQWLRAPDQPGDNGSPGTSTSAGGSPI